MQNTRQTFPSWALDLRKCRKKSGLSQTEFGELFGVSAMAVSYWESGTNEPPAKVLFWVLEASGMIKNHKAED